MTGRLSRPLRLAAAGVVVAALVATVGPGRDPATAAAPAPTSPSSPTSPAPPGQPTDPAGACPVDDGIEITGSLQADIAAADGHARPSSVADSVGVGCTPVPEDELGAGGDGIPAPVDVDPDADDWDDPFDRHGGLYLGYQFGVDGGLPDYWEQPIAPSAENAALLGGLWPGGLTYQLTVLSPAGGRETVNRALPPYQGCRWHGPVPATAMPRRVAAWAPPGRAIYRYDHVPQRIGSRKFARAAGGWFHYLCGAATPGHMTGPPAGARLSPLEAVYYLTPHWVYALGLSAADLDLVAPVLRAARTQVNARVVTSPVNRGVVNLKTWMWTDARRYDIVLPGRRATVEPTGIRVVAPGVPLVAHDIRRGGCRTGGRLDTGDPAGETDCYFTFTRASPSPRDAYQVGFAVRWRVTVAGVARPLTFWTTSVQSYTVGEVQVPNGGR